MRLLSLLALISLFSCQDYNSNSSDRELYGPVTLTGSASFKKAYPILMTRCASCHTSAIHSPWAGYVNEQTWIDKDYVVPQDTANSLIIRRTINSNQVNANMPQGGSALPDAEYQILLDWINNIP